MLQSWLALRNIETRALTTRAASPERAPPHPWASESDFMLISEGFQQLAPLDTDGYASDLALQALLRRLLPPDILPAVDGDLQRFSLYLASESHQTLKRAADEPEPHVVQYDNYGRRIDRLVTSEGWRAIKGVAAQEGLVSLAYRREHGEHSRIHSFAKIYLFAPESKLVGCPLSMTDGAARVLELQGTPEMREEVLPRLLSNDSTKSWMAAQWMTEREGGSDVNTATETTARASSYFADEEGAPFRLDGFKWFSSATDGQVALALARTVSDEPAQKGKLSLFLVRTRLEEHDEPEKRRNGIRIHRMKRKIGTKALPTAELELKWTQGHLVGRLGQGVKTISPVLNITRLHSAIGSIGCLHKCIDLAKAFARVRIIRGKPLEQNELHTHILSRLAVTHRALLHFSFGVVQMLGLSEAAPDMCTELLNSNLRLLTPVVKAFTAARVVWLMAEAMESMGGQGYMVETGIGELMADNVVERVWEGTQAVLADDVMRFIRKGNGEALRLFGTFCDKHLASVTDNLQLQTATSAVRDAMTRLEPAAQSTDSRILRHNLHLIGHIASSIFLLQHAVWCHAGQDADCIEARASAQLWIAEGGLYETVRAVDDILASSTSPADEYGLVYGRARL
ncbi:hypothetical protein E5Q_05069 [Mixia osmundae IAM 14324]|uniref:Acyl-CoA dehydrogenase/oxidase C-terminal domain-containing protein n=2 Tax=Mixia osmundae (strain CBS 9802 / IAM 14324 / JCM 22182 / KY 12970) TaxID=764103 RepID=G7E6C3_MIXOS|nr:hypothetical protein E5Q_05069 [Mixia osmundae IAM 14324]